MPRGLVRKGSCTTASHYSVAGLHPVTDLSLKMRAAEGLFCQHGGWMALLLWHFI